MALEVATVLDRLAPVVVAMHGLFFALLLAVLVQTPHKLVTAKYGRRQAQSFLSICCVSCRAPPLVCCAGTASAA
jgi:hypothetical protein